MKKIIKTPLAHAMGAMIISGFAANADANPFALTELPSGYMQVAVDLNNKVNESACGSNTGAKAPTAKKTEGSCGEGMCGAMMSGGKMKKGMESSCGAMMKNQDGACGMNMDKKPDHASKNANSPKTAESSCGAMMGGKGGESSCGAMMKGNEGSCGSKVDANKATGK